MLIQFLTLLLALELCLFGLCSSSRLFYAYAACLILQTAGLPESAKLQIQLQLTSPIEEASITTETPAATFRSVELGQAMLSLSAMDADVPLGSVAESVDLASLIQLDAMQAVSEYTMEKDFAFSAANDDKDAEPVFYATLKIVFAPSNKDLREELYELLNKATTKKAQAVEKLRQTALAASRQATASKRGDPAASPAVKAGFLNKKAEKKGGLEAVYDKYFGPTSLLRTVLPVAKNYIIFFAFVGVMHYKGDALSLPPPV